MTRITYKGLHSPALLFTVMLSGTRARLQNSKVACELMNHECFSCEILHYFIFRESERTQSLCRGMSATLSVQKNANLQEAHLHTVDYRNGGL